MLAWAVCFCVPDAFAQTPRPLKVFISVDMEGIAGAVSGSDVSPSGLDYPRFREIMTGEANAAIHGASDRAVIDQIRGLVGNIEAVAVKEAVEEGSLGMSPQHAQEAIRRGVEAGIRNRAQTRPYRLQPPYTMVLRVKEERGLYPGAQKSGDKEFKFTSSDLLQVLDAFNKMK
jgi:D-aminopeptidase